MSNYGAKQVLQEFQSNEIELAERLLELRQKPSPALRQRIDSIPQPKRPLGFWPRLAWGSLAVVIALLLVTSPMAKATLGDVQEVFGRAQLMVLDVLPLPLATAFVPEPTATVIIKSTPVTLSEAQAMAPFDIIIPAYLPEALLPDKEVLVTQLEQPIVTLRWRDRDGGFVQLTAHPYSSAGGSIKTLIGRDSSETLTINGHKAVIISGAWDQTSRTWREDTQIVTLIWEVDDIQYKLISFSELVPSAELVKIAETVR